MLSNGFHAIPPGKVAMIVTHLEMRQPQFRGAEQPDGLTFAPLARDLDVYRDLFQRVGQTWLWFGRLRLSDNALSDIITNPDVHLFALFKNGHPEALLELDYRVSGACELAYFGLTDALIGTGAGGFLMDRAVEHAFDAAIDRFHVHTCTIDSPVALAFYQRSGFVPVRQEVEVADDPRLTGVLPRSAGPNVPVFDP